MDHEFNQPVADFLALADAKGLPQQPIANFPAPLVARDRTSADEVTIEFRTSAHTQNLFVGLE